METFFNANRQDFLREAQLQATRALELLDANLTAEYRQAVAEAPQLVQQETQIIDFLRTDDYNPFKAAVRLANYWKFRKDIFGADRWLLPLKQKEGAMDATSVEILGSGFAVLVTKPQPVLFADFSKLLHNTSYAQAQILFYLLSVNTCEALQTDGLTTFHIISSRPRPLVLGDSK